MVTVLTILHVFICLFLILVVLLQAGKGGGMGIAFGGGGGSGSVFGGSGAGNFLTKLTAITATVFMLNSVVLAYLASARGSEGLRSYSERARNRSAAEADVRKQLDEQRGTMPTLPGQEEGAATPADPPEGDDGVEPGDEAAPATEPGDEAPAPAPASATGDEAIPPPATGTEANPATGPPTAP
jgi:preprotein translocase subunit SecG